MLHVWGAALLTYCAYMCTFMLFNVHSKGKDLFLENYFKYHLHLYAVAKAFNLKNYRLNDSAAIYHLCFLTYSTAPTEAKTLEEQ